MENRRGKLTLALMTLMLLLALALGAIAPSMATRLAEPEAGAIEWDGLHGLLADPLAGAGSGT